MSSFWIALVFFVCTAAGVLAGFWFRNKLPGSHIDADGRDTVKLATGLIATLSALVLGLLVASAKSSFDSVSTGLTDQAARIITLDNLFADYGPEAAGLREELHKSVAAIRNTLWPKTGSRAAALRKTEASEGVERLMLGVRGMEPATEVQRLIKGEALQITKEMARARWLVFLHAQAELPMAFLVCVLFWLTVLHGGFGLLSARNITVVVALLVSALTVSATVFLILELNRPLTGTINVPSAAFDRALSVLAAQAKER